MNSVVSFTIPEFSFPCLMICVHEMDNEEEARNRVVVLFTEHRTGTVVSTDKNKGINSHNYLGKWSASWNMKNFRYLPDLSVNLSNL